MNDSVRCLCESLYKSYGSKQVLRGCSLTVRAGERVGLVGENGSGKSTLVRCLLGFSQPSHGKTWVCRSVGYCPQEDYLNRRLTVAEHLSFMQRIYGQERTLDPTFSAMLVERLKLPPYLQTRIGQLSSGTYQKVKFVTSVIHCPELVLLDESCDGFDWAMYQVFWEIMTTLKERGRAVLMISHLLYDRDRFDRILELREGHCETAF